MGIVNQLADRSLPAFDECDDAIQTLQQRVHVLQCALAGTYHVGKVRNLAAGQNVTVGGLWSPGLRAVNVDVSFTEHARGRKQSQRIFAQAKAVSVFTFIKTSTGVSCLLGSCTTRILVTLPMSTPESRTGAPTRRPLALSKYDFQ